MKRKKKLLGLLLIPVLLTSCSSTATSYDINRYNEYLDKCDSNVRHFMPSIDSLSDYDDISVSLTSSSHFWGHKDTTPLGLILFVKYEKDIFDDKKEIINDKYTFVESSIINKYNDILIPAIDVVYCDYEIKVVYDLQFEYPKCFGMIGINDNKNTIAYLYYEDFSLDRLGNVKDSKDKQENYFIHAILSDVFVFPE